uniref:Retrotransposon gag domain-containing protein n=1 Tax=Manihot esculenta TaxID=3983 RepID=A0A2C9WHS9_MANES
MGDVFERIDNRIGSIKMKIPIFYGKNNPDTYLEWEREVELIFECHNYLEDKKVKLAVMQFKDYAILWRDQVQVKRRRNGGRPMYTWDEMKHMMRDKFVPLH